MLIRLTFRDGCSGDDEETMTFTAPRTFFWSFARWCEEGRARAIKMTEEKQQAKVYGPTDGKREAERLVREGHGHAAPMYDGPENIQAGDAGRHWTIEASRDVIDWYAVFYEHNRGGIPYRDPRKPEEPVYEVIFVDRFGETIRISERPVEV